MMWRWYEDGRDTWRRLEDDMQIEKWGYDVLIMIIILKLRPMMRMKRKRVWWLWDRLRRAWWRGLASGANEADFRADFLEQILGQIIWAGILLKPISGRSPTLGNEAQSGPSSEVARVGPKWGDRSTREDNKGRVDTWAQKWDENAPKKGDKKSGPRHHSALKWGKFLVPEDL